MRILWVACIVACSDARPPELADAGQADASTRLKSVRVATMHMYVIDHEPDRTMEERIRLFAETKTDLVFKGWVTRYPTPKRCSDLPDSPISGCQPATTVRACCAQNRLSYEELGAAISAIKSTLPKVLVGGGLPAQKVSQTDWDPQRSEPIAYPETWAMALDPTKWGIPVSKAMLQCAYAKIEYGFPPNRDCSEYQPKYADPTIKYPRAYYPDVTNTRFRALLSSGATAQIEAGVDLIWLDMLWDQASTLACLAKLGTAATPELCTRDENKDFTHASVRESVEAANAVMEEIRSIGERTGRRVYVGTWRPIWEPPSLYHSKQDFVTLAITPQEILAGQPSSTRWTNLIQHIQTSAGGVPIFPLFDWANSDATGMAVFGQRLDRAEQSAFLRVADGFFESHREEGVTFVYPLHGGYMGPGATRLAFGAHNWFDSLAPEFDTYATIVSLSNAKKP